MALLFFLLATLSAAGCQKIYSPVELQCLSKMQFFYKPTNSCYPALEKGPCSDGEWLILQKPPKTGENTTDDISVLCAEKKCNDSGIFWPEKGCLETSEDRQKVCESDPLTKLNYNDFGEAECLCPKTPPHGRLNNDETKPCLPLHTRGPCPARQIFAVSDNWVPSCIPDPCFNQSFHLKRAGLLSPNERLAMAPNGNCYKLGTVGPCTGDKEIWQIETVYGQPGCIGMDLNIPIGPCGGPCLTTLTSEAEPIGRRFGDFIRRQIEFQKRKKRHIPDFN